MNEDPTHSLSLRQLSALFLLDDDNDDDDQIDGHRQEQGLDGNQTILTQYSTPRAPDLSVHVFDKHVEVIDLRSPDVSPQGLKQIAYVPRTL